jgi:hypothetical protein
MAFEQQHNRSLVRHTKYITFLRSWAGE